MELPCRWNRYRGDQVHWRAPLVDGLLASVAHAQWVLRNGGTIVQAALTAGIDEDLAGLYAKKMWAGRLRARR